MTAGLIRARMTRCRSRLIIAVALTLLSADAARVSAQEGMYRISQRATLSQKLGGTLVSLDYSRPLTRGRSDIFGKVVHWGELWTPGANEATVLEVSDTITLDGHEVPTGRWSMWVIPSQVGPWELVLDPRDSLFHTQRPELTDEQIRFPLKVTHDAPHVEALTWAFPRIAQDGATLQMNWANTQIPLEVGVAAETPELKVSADEAAAYVGEWQVTFEPRPGMPAAMPPTVLTVQYNDEGLLRASFPPGVFAPPPPPEAPPEEANLSPQERERAEARRTLAQMEGDFSYVLVPRARGIFLLGWVDDGVLLDVEEMFHEFELEGDRAVRLTVRNGEDQVMGRATRKAP